MSKESITLRGAFAKPLPFLIAAAIGLILCAISFMQESKSFFVSYLTAFVFFLAIALGALFFILVNHLSRSSWSVTVRRLAETLAANLQWMGLLFIPLLFGVHQLFHWTHADVRATDALIQSKAAYLNEPFFYARAAFYFLVWFLVSRYFYRNSLEQDKTGDTYLSYKMGKWSSLGLIFFGLTLTFFAFDWIMSLDPHWFSTIFGVYYFAGCVVSFYATLIIIAFLLQKTGNLREYVNVEHYHDLGKLLFGHNIFWAYSGFSQFMLIWYANIPEETLFFHHRAGDWKLVSLILPWGHFALPFLFLMSRNVKRRKPLLVLGAVWLLLMCFVDIYWLIQPNFHHHPHFGLGDIGSILLIGGVFFFLFFQRLKKHSILAYRDPRLSQSLSYDNG